MLTVEFLAIKNPVVKPGLIRHPATLIKLVNNQV